jgi:hypothetical protein
MKNIIYIIIAVITIIIVIVLLRGNEDNWICQNVVHGSSMVVHHSRHQHYYVNNYK